MKVIVAGPGAFGIKHLDGIKNIDDVEVVGLVGRRLENTQAVANEYGIPNVFTSLEDALKLDADAVILCTPTQQHAEQSIQCMKAGKNVQVEIPLSDSWKDAQAVLDVQKETGLTCMVGHTRRFNPSHQWINKRINKGG
jgi:2-hydroxy-4-carboxymuconate semialdehyde hemiacetal dehydrogenase